ncbi:hypothetical protein P280DRAFT_510318 [Massarina eburnea CBS 473.64]|uniref:Uncharacterized protein n=1 Tax=Massarina eburnea CBS 473.64 TaxID=1395130 RepID=A0A6A6RQ21_9PLEO|nr:hypothetical protein P280DRAFT_510318 [Massarina eburnea CBS 473.64]
MVTFWLMYSYLLYTPTSPSQYPFLTTTPLNKTPHLLNTTSPHSLTTSHPNQPHPKMSVPPPNTTTTTASSSNPAPLPKPPNVIKDTPSTPTPSPGSNHPALAVQSTLPPPPPPSRAIPSPPHSPLYHAVRDSTPASLHGATQSPTNIFAPSPTHLEQGNWVEKITPRDSSSATVLRLLGGMSVGRVSGSGYGGGGEDEDEGYKEYGYADADADADGGDGEEGDRSVNRGSFSLGNWDSDDDDDDDEDGRARLAREEYADIIASGVLRVVNPDIPSPIKDDGVGSTGLGHGDIGERVTKFDSKSLGRDSVDYSRDGIEDVVDVQGKIVTATAPVSASHRPQDLQSILSGERSVTSEDVKKVSVRRKELEAEIEEERLRHKGSVGEGRKVGGPSLKDLEESGFAVPLAEGVVVVDAEGLDELFGGGGVWEGEDGTKEEEKEMEKENEKEKKPNTPPFANPISPTTFIPSTPTPLTPCLRRRASTSAGLHMPSSAYSPDPKVLAQDQGVRVTDRKNRHIHFASPAGVKDSPFKKTLDYFKQYKGDGKGGGKENSPSKNRRNTSLPQEIAEMVREAGLGVDGDGSGDMCTHAIVSRGFCHECGTDVVVANEDEVEEDVEVEVEDDADTDDLDQYRDLDLAPMDPVIEDGLAGDLIMLATPTPSRVHEWTNKKGGRMGAGDFLAENDGDGDAEEEMGSVTPSDDISMAGSDEGDMGMVYGEVRNDLLSDTDAASADGKQLILYPHHPVIINVIAMLPAAMFWGAAAPVAALSSMAYDGLVERLFGLRL